MFEFSEADLKAYEGLDTERYPIIDEVLIDLLKTVFVDSVRHLHTPEDFVRAQGQQQVIEHLEAVLASQIGE